MLNDPLYIGSLNWPSVKKSNWGRPIARRWDHTAGCKQNPSAEASSLKATNIAASHPLASFCHCRSCQLKPWAGRREKRGQRRAPVPILAPLSIVALHSLQNLPRDWVQHGNSFIDSCSFQKTFWPLQLGMAWMCRLQRHWGQRANIKALNILDDVSYFKSISWFRWGRGEAQKHPAQDLKCPWLAIKHTHSTLEIKAAVPCAGAAEVLQLHCGRRHSYRGCIEPHVCWVQHELLQKQ